jgi:hypothetical protein
MTLYDLIMGMKFGKSDWAALGRGEILNEETIGKMLMEGYEAVADED